MMALAELIHELERADGPLTTAELAARIGTRPEVVGGMLDWLARSGRVAAPCDPTVCGVRSACASCALAPLQAGRRYLPLRVRTPGRRYGAGAGAGEEAVLVG